MRRYLVLTGAGISAESGLRTFRDTGGLWEDHPIEDVATPEGFIRNPALVHAFYNARRAAAHGAQPNAAHYALTQLRSSDHADVTLVTQNVDSLHEAAGFNDVIHMHGQLNQVLCANCEHRWPAPAETNVDSICPNCQAQAVRPDIVWFGEMPYHMDRIYHALENADVFVAIGTSGQVYPAAGFVEVAATAGLDTVEINLEPSGNPLFDEVITGPATKAVTDWVARSLV